MLNDLDDDENFMFQDTSTSTTQTDANTTSADTGQGSTPVIPGQLPATGHGGMAR